MKNKVLIGVVGAFVVTGAVAFLLSNQASSPMIPAQNQDEMLSPSVNEEISEASPDTSELGMGGSSYRDTKGVYTFLYPNEYSIDGQDTPYVRIYKRGESQRPQSEMSDGVLVVFESIDLAGKTLEELVDSRIQQATADGTSEIIQPKKATTVNNYLGFTYGARGLGESTNIFLQKNPQSSSAVVITYAISDPQQKGYQAELESILSTIELQK